jgi:signal transduction histidine kinase
MASHELKTPLTSLILQLQLAQHRLVNEPKKVSRALAICHEQARRINGLVEDLLDVSRIELGKLQLKFEPVDLAELVEDAATRLADFLEKSGSEFRMHIDVARPFPVVADRFRLDQVLENLLSNSAKYGGGKPITLSLKETGGFAEITVADQGNGVAKDKQALIFNRFERVGDNVNISGLGLGLFIAREIVSAHHGSIAIDSEPGNGAAFTVKLPIHQPSI